MKRIFYRPRAINFMSRVCKLYGPHIEKCLWNELEGAAIPTLEFHSILRLLVLNYKKNNSNLEDSFPKLPLGGLEPATSGMPRRRSNRLRHGAGMKISLGQEVLKLLLEFSKKK